MLQRRRFRAASARAYRSVSQCKRRCKRRCKDAAAVKPSISNGDAAPVRPEQGRGLLYICEIYFHEHLPVQKGLTIRLQSCWRGPPPSPAIRSDKHFESFRAKGNRERCRSNHAYPQIATGVWLKTTCNWQKEEPVTHSPPNELPRPKRPVARLLHEPLREPQRPRIRPGRIRPGADSRPDWISGRIGYSAAWISSQGSRIKQG